MKDDYEAFCQRFMEHHRDEFKDVPEDILEDFKYFKYLTFQVTAELEEDIEVFFAEKMMGTLSRLHEGCINLKTEEVRSCIADNFKDTVKMVLERVVRVCEYHTKAIQMAISRSESEDYISSLGLNEEEKVEYNKIYDDVLKKIKDKGSVTLN